MRTGIASAALHVIVIALLALSTRTRRSLPGERAQQSSVPVAVTMMYVPPKEVPTRPKPHPPQPTPAPAEAAPPRTPESALPAPFNTAKAPEHDDPAAMSPEPKPDSRAEDPESRTTERHAPLEDQMVLEARRIFGPKTASEGGLAGPVEAGQPVALMGGGSRCSWEGDDAGANGGGPDNGVVEGVVRSERDGLPVPGAFLQLLGTGSATFADDVGHYRLHFDPKLVDRCHSQVVRVTAPGYRARTMVLAYGTWSDNVVDMKGR